jgi:hypothetical protein
MSIHPHSLTISRLVSNIQSKSSSARLSYPLASQSPMTLRHEPVTRVSKLFAFEEAFLHFGNTHLPHKRITHFRLLGRGRERGNRRCRHTHCLRTISPQTTDTTPSDPQTTHDPYGTLGRKSEQCHSLSQEVIFALNFPQLGSK